MKHAYLPVALIALLCGCITLNKPAVIEMVANRAGDAAKIAVLADLQANPTHRPQYEAAVLMLDGLMQAPTYSSASLEAILATLPIKEFRGLQGAIVLKGGLMVFDLLTMFGYKVESIPAIVQVVAKVREGIASALAEPAPSSLTRAMKAGQAAPVKPLVAKRVIRI